MNPKVQKWAKAAVGLALTFGVLDPVLRGVSEFAGKFRIRLLEGIERSKLVWEWKRSTGEAPEETFGEFFTGYINGVLADALDQNHIDMPVVASTFVGLLGSMMGTDAKFWAASLKDPNGFFAGALGQKVGATGFTVYEQIQPVFEHVLMRIQNDYTQAVQWKQATAGGGPRVA